MGQMEMASRQLERQEQMCEKTIEIIHGLDFIHTEVEFGAVKMNWPGIKVYREQQRIEETNILSKVIKQNQEHWATFPTSNSVQVQLYFHWLIKGII